MGANGAALRFGENTAGCVTVNYAAMGREDAPLILMLHGFPEYWAGWRAVMERLAQSYFVVAPDQRGYNRSSKPEGIENYRAKALVDDVVALADKLSPGRPFVLAGHDWGASVAYAYAFAHPERLSHLVIANGVHPACFQRALFEDEAQREASRYFHYLTSHRAEEGLSQDNHRRLMQMLSSFSDTSWLTDDEAVAYRAVWNEPGALTAMLNWYRASPIIVPDAGAPVPAGRSVLDLPVEGMTVAMPHLVLWGEADTALLPSCLQGLDRYAPQLTVKKIPGASHWILHEKPDEVATAIAAFVED
ncbi:MAG: alpha/beta hydrolase [Rhizobiaceae bacterium]|nr:alpha/beta hydrolase [Rhizobiaceae bacterium]